MYRPREFLLDGGFDIFDVYKIGDEPEAILNKFGTWNPNDGLEVSNANIWERRVSMNGYHLR